MQAAPVLSVTVPTCAARLSVRADATGIPQLRPAHGRAVVHGMRTDAEPPVITLQAADRRHIAWAHLAPDAPCPPMPWRPPRAHARARPAERPAPPPAARRLSHDVVAAWLHDRAAAGEPVSVTVDNGALALTWVGDLLAIRTLSATWRILGADARLDVDRAALWGCYQTSTGELVLLDDGGTTTLTPGPTPALGGDA